MVSCVWAQEFQVSYAVVVGIDDYSSLGMSKLKNAESDARAVAEYLRAQGYEVVSLIGPERGTKRALDSAVQRIADRIGENDRFMFFFAGHGKSKRQEEVDVAYLVVSGGVDKNDPDTLVSSGDVARYSRLLDRARHQLFVFDSCYAGLMGHFEARSDKDPSAYDSETHLVRDLQRRRVRQYLSAGGEDQEVLDNGPSNLSWFTYFLLKGLEPNVASRRTSGLITFSELASYVQALSANPKHTPAFGSLAGHRGGEFLFLSTARGSPRLERLPNISVQTLRDLGFLTRNDQPASISGLIDSMREPIDLIFQAWTEKNLDLYLRQFDPSVVQTGRWKRGGKYSRGYDEIKNNRTSTFGRLDHADVLKYEVMYQGSEGSEATFGVRYSMDFYWLNGKVTRERNINECYKVRKHPSEERWLIIRNDDYQHRICE